MKSITRWLLLPFVLVIILTIAYSPIPIPHYLDFLSIYHADLGVLRGIPLYDLTGQVGMVAELAGVPPDQVVLLPFVYPPWYALLTLPLALLPIEVAARLWFGLNLLMVTLFVWLMTEDWPTIRRIVSLLLAVLFLPVLGALIVGQFVFPVLLGAGILVYALRRENMWLTAIALFLLTFKPHIGGLVFLAGIVYLILKRTPFARRALWATGGILLFFFAASFFVDSAWPVHYYETLFGFREVSPCVGLCISVPMAVTSMFGADFTRAIWVAGILLVVWIGLFLRYRPILWKDEPRLISAGFCITLLSSPYQYNYDFVVLLLPFLLLASTVHRRLDWLWLAFAYFLPWVGLIFSRGGNYFLLFSVLLVTGLIYFRAAKQAA